MKLIELDRHRYKRTWNLLLESVRENGSGYVSPGIAIGIWSKDAPELFQFAVAGDAQKYPKSDTLHVRAKFDLASLTKIIVTATLCEDLIERGWLGLNDRVSDFFPEFKSSEVQIHHLLTHTAGFPASPSYFELIQKRFSGQSLRTIPLSELQNEMRNLVLATEPEVRTGERMLYDDPSFILLHFIVEKVLSSDLKSYCDRHLFPDTSFEYRLINETADSDIQWVATDQSEWRGGVMRGEVGDENCWSMGGVSCHAGLFGRLEDVLRFAGEAFDRWHKPRSLLRMMSSKWKDYGRFGLGWDTPSGDRPSMGRYFSDQTFGHLGFTGTSLWIDPVRGLAVSLLTNRVHPNRENERIKTFRPQVHDTLLEEYLGRDGQE